MNDETDWYGPDAATFGDRLAGAREAAGMTQSQLARRLGVKKATIAAWENDLSEPRANKLQMLSGVLDVSIPWLLTGDGAGVDPVSDAAETPEVSELMSELRFLRAEMLQSAEKLGVIEKRLKGSLARPVDVVE